MPDPTAQQGHYDQLLTDLSVGFMQDDDAFVADKAFPVVPVAKESAFYWIYPAGYFFRDDVAKRPMGGYSPVTGYQLTKGSYFAEEEGLAAFLDDRERANSTPPNDPERGKIKVLTSQHQVHKDKRWCSGYFGSGIWTTDLTGVTSAPSGSQELKWSLSSSSPIKTVKTRKRAVKKLTGYEPNVLILGSDVEIALCEHPDLIDRIKYTQKGTVDLDLLAGYFGVDKVVTATGVQNTADEGQTASNSFIADSKSALLVYAAPEPGLEVPSGGYIFSWTGLLGSNAVQTPSAVWRGRDERAHSDWFEVRCAYDMAVVAPDLGVFFGSIVA